MITVQGTSGQGLGFDMGAFVTGLLNIIRPDQPAPTAPPPPPPKTGWAALSTGTQVAIVGGGIAAVGLVAYLALRR